MVTPQPTTHYASWTVGAIRGALNTLQQGDFSTVDKLLNSMWEDDTFPSTLSQRINATLRSEFQLALPGEARDLNEVETKIQTHFPQMAPDCELFGMLEDYIMLGAGVGTIDWDTSDPKLWVPKLRALPAEFLRYDEGRRKWTYMAIEGELDVTPGDGKWVLMAAGQEPWTRGLLRGLAFLWFGKQMTLGDWQRYNQKHGLPIIKATVPLHHEKSEKDGFIDDLSEMQAEGVIGTPKDENGQGYDVDLLEARDTAWESFQTAAERADRKYQVALLGGNLGAEVTSQGANRAASETHAKSVDRDKAKTDAKALGTVLRDQLLVPFMQQNYPDATVIPFPFWDTNPEESIRQWVTAQSQFIHMLAQLPAAGYKLKNAVAIARDYDMRLEELAGGPDTGAGDGGGITHKETK